MKRKRYRIYFGENVLLISKVAQKGYQRFDGTLKEVADEVQKGKLKGRWLYVAKSPQSAWQRFRAMFGIVQAAGGLVVNPEGRTLLMFRRGKWDLPKGKRDKGESLRNCALREVEEECGVSGLKIVRKLPLTYHTYLYKKRVVLKQTTWYKMTCANWKDASPETEEGITEVKWVTKAQFKSSLKNSYASIRGLAMDSVPGLRS